MDEKETVIVSAMKMMIVLIRLVQKKPIDLNQNMSAAQAMLT